MAPSSCLVDKVVLDWLSLSRSWERLLFRLLPKGVVSLIEAAVVVATVV